MDNFTYEYALKNLHTIVASSFDEAYNNSNISDKLTTIQEEDSIYYEKRLKKNDKYAKKFFEMNIDFYSLSSIDLLKFFTNFRKTNLMIVSYYDKNYSYNNTVEFSFTLASNLLKYIESINNISENKCYSNINNFLLNIIPFINIFLSSKQQNNIMIIKNLNIFITNYLNKESLKNFTENSEIKKSDEKYKNVENLNKEKPYVAIRKIASNNNKVNNSGVKKKIKKRYFIILLLIVFFAISYIFKDNISFFFSTFIKSYNLENKYNFISELLKLLQK